MFVGKTSTGNFRVPYRISAPANPSSVIGNTVLVEPPHFATGTYLREGYLGRPFLFGRGFLHASVGYSTYSMAPPPDRDVPDSGESRLTYRILDPAAQGVFIHGGVVLPGEDGWTDDEIVVAFARALRSDPLARALMGPVARCYLAGFSDSAEPVKRIVASRLAEDVFDLAVPIITRGGPAPQVSIAAGKYSGKVITVDSEAEWSHGGRALEDRGTTPGHYRFFIVPGTPHVPDPLCPFYAIPHTNRSTPASWQPALRAHFLQGHAWVTQGNAPPTSTRLATAGGDAQIVRDSHGNALLVEITGAPAPRLPFVELGEAKFNATTDATELAARKLMQLLGCACFRGRSSLLKKSRSSRCDGHKASSKRPKKGVFGPWSGAKVGTKGAFQQALTPSTRVGEKGQEGRAEAALSPGPTRAQCCYFDGAQGTIGCQSEVDTPRPYWRRLLAEGRINSSMRGASSTAGAPTPWAPRTRSIHRSA